LADTAVVTAAVTTIAALNASTMLARPLSMPDPGSDEERWVTMGE
jgi:hypothetical protein